MNYAKVIDAALQLFPKKINVTAINEVTGAKIGTFKIPLSQLPAKFNRPTILEIEGKPWRVIKAQPVSADDFSITKKLTIHTLEKKHWQDDRLKFNVPTRHSYHPLMSHTSQFNDFILDLREEDWRQIEFLPDSSLPVVQSEMAYLEPILNTDTLFGYDIVHVRQNTASIPLQIEITDFCKTIKAQNVGTIRIYGNAFVQNGIAIETENYRYYGIINDDIITSLCLPVFDCIDDEFMKVITSYNLVLVDWLEGRILMRDGQADVAEVTEKIKDFDVTDKVFQ